MATAKTSTIPTASHLLASLAEGKYAKALPRRYYDVFQGVDQKWRWHARDGKNHKVTQQGESHPDSTKAIRAIRQEREAVGATGELLILVHSTPLRVIREGAKFERRSLV